VSTRHRSVRSRRPLGDWRPSHSPALLTFGMTPIFRHAHPVLQTILRRPTLPPRICVMKPCRLWHRCIACLARKWCTRGTLWQAAARPLPLSPSTTGRFLRPPGRAGEPVRHAPNPRSAVARTLHRANDATPVRDVTEAAHYPGRMGSLIVSMILPQVHLRNGELCFESVQARSPELADCILGPRGTRASPTHRRDQSVNCPVPCSASERSPGWLRIISLEQARTLSPYPGAVVAPGHEGVSRARARSLPRLVALGSRELSAIGRCRIRGRARVVGLGASSVGNNPDACSHPFPSLVPAASVQGSSSAHPGPPGAGPGSAWGAHPLVLSRAQSGPLRLPCRALPAEGQRPNGQPCYDFSFL
jgi:hypothetical protein